MEANINFERLGGLLRLVNSVNGVNDVNEAVDVNEVNDVNGANNSNRILVGRMTTNKPKTKPRRLALCGLTINK